MATNDTKFKYTTVASFSRLSFILLYLSPAHVALLLLPDGSVFKKHFDTPGYCPMSRWQTAPNESQRLATGLIQKLACFFKQLFTLYFSIIFATCSRQFTVTVTVTICGDACPLTCASAEAYKLAQCTRPQGWGS